MVLACVWISTPVQVCLGRHCTQNIDLKDAIGFEFGIGAGSAGFSNTATAGVALVVASQTTDDTTWLEDAFSNWERYIYVTDDAHASLRVPANKGREGMVYLTCVFITETRWMYAN